MLFSCFEEFSEVLRYIFGWLTAFLVDLVIDVVALENCVACDMVHTGKEVCHKV